MSTVTLNVEMTPEVLAALRTALAWTPAQIDAVALAVVEQLKREYINASASMTVKEFATQARLDVSTVHKLIKRGRLEATNPGGGDRRITAAAAAKYFAGAGNADVQ